MQHVHGLISVYALCGQVQGFDAADVGFQHILRQGPIINEYAAVQVIEGVEQIMGNERSYAIFAVVPMPGYFCFF